MWGSPNSARSVVVLAMNPPGPNIEALIKDIADIGWWLVASERIFAFRARALEAMQSSGVNMGDDEEEIEVKKKVEEEKEEQQEESEVDSEDAQALPTSMKHGKRPPPAVALNKLALPTSEKRRKRLPPDAALDKLALPTSMKHGKRPPPASVL